MANAIKWKTYFFLNIDYEGQLIEVPKKYTLYWKDGSSQEYTNLSFLNILDILPPGTILYVDDLPRIYGFYRNEPIVDKNLKYHFYQESRPQFFHVNENLIVRDAKILEITSIQELNELASHYKNISEIPHSIASKVRNEFRPLMRSGWKLTRQKLNHDTEILSKIYVGGDCGLKDPCIKTLMSFDRKSAYIAEIINNKFPAKFFVYHDKDNATEEKLKKPHIVRVKFTNIRCTGINCSIFKEWVEQGTNVSFEDKRLTSADEVVLLLTSLDLDTIRYWYTFESEEIINYYFCSCWHYLPDKVREKAFDMFQGRKENPALKRDCAIIYGLFCNDPTKDDYTFEKKTNEEKKVKLTEPTDFPFRIGVFIAAYARKHLNDLMYKLREYLIYWDTDCVKCLCNDKVNEIIDEENKALAVNFKGQETLLGQFLYEGTNKYYIYSVKHYLKDNVPVWAGADIDDAPIEGSSKTYKDAIKVVSYYNEPYDQFKSYTLIFRSDLTINKRNLEVIYENECC